MVDDLKFLKDSSRWPHFAAGQYCCLKRQLIKGYEFGFLILSEGFKVHLGDIFSGGTGQSEQYDSAESVIAAGWLVD